MRRILLPVFFALAITAYAIFFYAPYERSCSFYSMGGILTEVKAYGTSKPRFDRACRNIQGYFEDMENEISIYRKNSFISKLNAQPQKQKVKLPENTFNLVKESLKVSKDTNGYYDITVLPILDLWSHAEKINQLPTTAEIQSALKKVSYKKLKLNEKAHELSFLEKGMELDFGAIGKGYMGDAAIKIMQKEGIPRGLLNCGGGIVVYDISPHPQPFHIQIYNPDETPRTHENPNIIELTNGSVQTSGDYNRFHKIQGKEYSHIIDPHDGEPAGRCHSITVKSISGTLADAYGTGFCSMIAAGQDPKKLKIQDVEIVQLKIH